MTTSNTETTLIVGATGYLGRVSVAGLIEAGHSRLALAVRQHHRPQDVLDGIEAELVSMGFPEPKSALANVSVIPLPEAGQAESFLSTVKSLNVNEIIHSAGSVEYSNPESLKEVNINLTERLLTVGEKLDIRRFIYLSTAFSSGFVNGLITEKLHNEPLKDPTEYTRSKREAEVIITSSTLPFLIVRPSVVIGHSRTGRYAGKPYGLYQLWTAAERFLIDDYREELHMIAPQHKLQVVHEDALQSGFVAAYEQLPNNTFVHLVSRESTLPTVRDVYDLWLRACNRPHRVYYYNSLEDTPQQKLDRRTRMWLEFAAVNISIAAHIWQFETKALDELRAKGLKYNDATIDTVAICQERFVNNSQRLQDFIQRNKHLFPSKTESCEPSKVKI